MVEVPLAELVNQVTAGATVAGLVIGFKYLRDIVNQVGTNADHIQDNHARLRKIENEYRPTY